MVRKKIKLDAAVERVAEIIQRHLGILSPAEAKNMREEIRALAVKASRASRRSKVATAGCVKARLIVR
jgi:hypothetical protein